MLPEPVRGLEYSAPSQTFPATQWTVVLAVHGQPDETGARVDLAAKRQVSAGAIDVALRRLRQRFGALLRRRVAQTVSTEGELDDELRYLMSVVGGGS